MPGAWALTENKDNFIEIKYFAKTYTTMTRKLPQCVLLQEDNVDNFV